MRLLVAALLIAGLACSSRSREHQDEPPAAPPTTPGPAPAEALPARPPPAEAAALPDQDPRYPTVAASGTEHLFLAEEPDRGPTAATAFAVPSKAALPRSPWPFCAFDATSITCSPGKTAPGWGWLVGRSKELVLAEELRAGRIERTIAFVNHADGQPDRRITLDRHGRVVATLLFDGDGRYRGRRRDGGNALPGCGQLAYERDAAGRISAESCQQWGGARMRDLHGIVTTRYQHDARGFVTEEARLGLDGEPGLGLDGVHRIRHELDPLGRPIVDRYQGLDGASVADRSGCHGTRRTLDDHGALLATTCLAADDHPTAAVSKASTKIFRRDARGCVAAERYQDAAGRAIVVDGIAGQDFDDDDDCAPRTRTCRDLAGAAAPCSPGQPARFHYQRDAAGQVTATTYGDARGAPTGDPDYGVDEIRERWDDLGHAVSRACFTGGRPVTCATAGLHEVRTRFDAVGRASELSFFDEHGAQVSNNGAVFRRAAYDNYDHESLLRDYDAQGVLTDSFGVAIVRELYDPWHRPFAHLMFDRARKPAGYTGTHGGYHGPGVPWQAVRIVRRADGVVEHNLFFDTTGRLIEQVDCTAVRCYE